MREEPGGFFNAGDQAAAAKGIDRSVNIVGVELSSPQPLMGSVRNVGSRLGALPPTVCQPQLIKLQKVANGITHGLAGDFF